MSNVIEYKKAVRAVNASMATALAAAKEQATATARVVLTDGAIFHRDVVCVGGVGDGNFLLCHDGDIVILTDAECEAHRVSGVELMDLVSQEAAE